MGCHGLETLSIDGLVRVGTVKTVVQAAADRQRCAERCKFVLLRVWDVLTALENVIPSEYSGVEGRSRIFHRMWSCAHVREYSGDAVVLTWVSGIYEERSFFFFGSRVLNN